MRLHHSKIGIANASLTLLVGMLAVGCDDAASGAGGATGSTSVASTSVASTSVASTGSGTDPCGPGTELCGDVCTSTAFDPENCGKCGTACDAEQEVCATGGCVPSCGANGLLKCGDDCVDQMSDAQHCGQCDKACVGAEACIDGYCVAPTAPKAVYTMTNDPSGNKILSFPRAADGTLSQEGTFAATGGRGTGAGLGNQHGLIFDQATKRFFAVNAGDHTVSMLALNDDGTLDLLANVAAGGERPISATVAGDVLYVLNAGIVANGTAGNITGFKIVGAGLTPIAGSTRPLSAPNPNPAQIQFSPDGKHLVVTEKGTNLVDTYALTGDLAGAPVTTASAGPTPFGFDFDAAGHVIVSEAAGGMAGLSSVSSYTIGAAGSLSAATAALGTTRTAACWLVVAGAYAYVANAQTNDITGLAVAADGSLSLLDPTGVSGMAAPAPVDEDVTDDGGLLYVVTNGGHAFSIFQIGATGALTKMPDFTGLPTTASGIVAR